MNAVSLNSLLQALPGNPDCYLHQLDFINRRALVVRIDEAVYRQAPFLDGRALNQDTEGAWVPLREVLLRTQDRIATRSLDYLFHTGHCGSTLVSKFIGTWPGAHVIREPLPLLSLSMLKRELDTPLCPINSTDWRQALDAALKLSARTYRSGDTALVKATSVCGNLVDDALAWSPKSRLVLLHVDLATHLKIMLKSEANRENARAFAPQWLSDFHRLTDSTDVRLHELGDAQQTGMNWLMTMHGFVRAANTAPARTLLVDFESFLEDMETGLARIADFLDKPVPIDDIRALVNGPAAKAYAKQPQRPYGRQLREQALAESGRQFASEIRTGWDWARRLIDETPALAGLESYLSINGYL